MVAGFRIVLYIAVFAFRTGFGSGERLFAPSADLWKRWENHDPVSTAVIDHGVWDRLLKRYIVPGRDDLNACAVWE